MFGRGLFVLCLSVAAWGQNEPAAHGNDSLQTARPAAAATNHSLFYVYSLLDQGKYENAVSEFTALIQSNPKWIEAHLGLIRALFQAGNLPAATRAAENAAQANPESAPIHAMLADLLFRSGRFEAAEVHYQAALGADAGLGRAWIGLGKIYSVRSMPEEARQAFQKALESDPQVFSAWLGALSSSEQRATYRRYAVADEEQTPPACEISLAGANGDERSHGSHNREVRLTPILDREGNMRAHGLKARINGRASALLMLDTGASGITIGSRLAEKAGLLKSSDRRLPGLGGTGSAHGYFGRAARLQIGDLELRNCTVQVSPENQILSQDGLIGTDVFEKYLITLDFPGRKMTLSEHADPAGVAEPYDTRRTAIRAYEFAHMLLLPATLGEGASGLFVLDTGANADTVSTTAVSKVGGMVSAVRFIEGTTGALNSALGTDSARLRIGDIELNQQRVASLDLRSLSQRLGTEVAGQLGFNSLRNVIVQIDYATGVVSIQR